MARDRAESQFPEKMQLDCTWRVLTPGMLGIRLSTRRGAVHSSPTGTVKSLRAAAIRGTRSRRSAALASLNAVATLSETPLCNVDLDPLFDGAPANGVEGLENLHQGWEPGELT